MKPAKKTMIRPDAFGKPGTGRRGTFGGGGRTKFKGGGGGHHKK